MYWAKLAIQESQSATGQNGFAFEGFSSPSVNLRNSAQRVSWDNSHMSTNSPTRIRLTSLAGTVGRVTPIENFWAFPSAAFAAPFAAFAAASAGRLVGSAPFGFEPSADLVGPVPPQHDHRPCPGLYEHNNRAISTQSQYQAYASQSQSSGPMPRLSLGAIK